MAKKPFPWPEEGICKIIDGVMLEGGLAGKTGWYNRPKEEHLHHAMKHILMFLNPEEYKDEQDINDNHLQHALTRLMMANAIVIYDSTVYKEEDMK